MGLNAKSMQQKKGKKGGGGKKGKGPKPASQTSKAVDTTKREYIYQMNKLTKVFPNGDKVLNDIYLSFFPGAKIGVLGLNGAGKSTLMKIMAGLDTEYNGDAAPASWCKVGYLPQEPTLDDGATVGENVESAVRETRELLDRYNELSASLTSNPDDSVATEMERVQNAIESKNGWQLDNLLQRSMDALRCPPAEALVETLSGGERRRVALAKLLLEAPDLLLLDEPTNHLDAISVAWLENYLQTFPGTVVAITHDRYFLDNVAQWILELDGGKGLPFEGNYSGWLAKKQERLAQEKRQNAKLATTLANELEWMQSNAKAKQTKQKARISRYTDLVESAEAIDPKSIPTQIYVPPGPRLGEQVVELSQVAKHFGDRILYQDVSFSVPRGSVVGVVGANGAGKSTILKLISKQAEPDKGSVTVGETVKVMYVDQNREELTASNTVFDELSDGGNDFISLGKLEVNSRQYCGWFNFKGASQSKKVGELSGGERNRLNLARVLKQNGNLLLLDEPTNDLDVDTLRALEEAILGFGGSVICVSHDRWFLNRIATHILAFQDDGTVEWFEGDYQMFEERQIAKYGDLVPKKLQYNKIPAFN